MLSHILFGFYIWNIMHYDDNRIVLSVLEMYGRRNYGYRRRNYGRRYGYRRRRYY